MNCDQAFECLTDPETGGDSALQDHLEHCPRCRDMAEILEPALRYVTGDAAQTWSTSAWELPANVVDQVEQPQPFLTEQAVRVAEEASTRLSARNNRRQRSRRNRWLAVTLLAPMVALALFLAEQEDAPTSQPAQYRASGPALGTCTRASVAMLKKREDTDREISAYEVVLSCNVCHLLDRPVRRGAEDPLKLQPANPRKTGSHWESAPGAAHVLTGISFRWQMAASASRNRAC
jgi:hypothetical protein